MKNEKNKERELPERFKAGTESMKLVSKGKDTKTKPIEKEEEKPIKKSYEHYL